LAHDEDVSEDKVVHDRGLSDIYWKSEQLDNVEEVEEGDDEDISTNGQFSYFKLPKNMTDFSWDIGTYFTNKETFKDAIRCYVVHSGRNLKTIKNDNRRVRVK